MKIDNRSLEITVLNIFLLVMAVVIDRFLPNRVIVASLYTLPTLLVALFYGPRIITTVGFVSVTVYIVESVYEGIHVVTLLSGILGFATICFLAVQFSRQRQKAVQKADEARKARRRLEMFLGTVAHDVSQPITAIKLYLGLMPKENTEKINRLRNNLDFAVQYTEHLINDLRDAATIEGGDFSIHAARTDVVDLLKQVIRQQKTTVNNGVIKLTAPKKLEGKWDKQRLAQLFTNLLANAVKYTGKNKRINVGVSNTDGQVLVTISDNGFGMTNRQIEEMFKPFTRFHKDVAKGTGLGLYISFWIVKAHGGKIWAKSKVHEGTTFYVRLPLDRGDNE